MRTWLPRAAIALATLGVCTPARATDSPSGATGPATAEARRSAKLQYRKGVEAYASGRYAEAIGLFRSADGLSPSAALSFNIARAYAKIGDAPATLAWYRDYLRRAPEADDAEAVAQSIDELEGQLAARGVQQVTALSSPSGATVMIDGQPVGVTPWTSELTPGPHQVAFRLRGFADVERSVELTRADALDVSATLYPDTTTPAFADTPTTGPTPAPPALEKQESSAMRPLRTAGFVAVGAGAGAFGGALIFELLRKSAANDARSEPEQLRAADRLNTAESRATVARVFAGLGAAMAVTGGVLLVLDARKKDASAPRVGFGCTGVLCGLSASGAFQ